MNPVPNPLPIVRDNYCMHHCEPRTSRAETEHDGLGFGVLGFETEGNRCCATKSFSPDAALAARRDVIAQVSRCFVTAPW
jgi:hypothetical protein